MQKLISKIKIRKADINDSAKIAECLLICWQEAYAGILDNGFLVKLGDVIIPDNYNQILGGEHNIFLAEADQEAIGIVNFGASRQNEYSGNSEIYLLYLRKAWWGFGIGKLLLKTAEEKIYQKNPFAGILVTVLTANIRAQEFYKYQGYRPLPSSHKQFNLFSYSYPTSLWSKSFK